MSLTSIPPLSNVSSPLSGRPDSLVAVFGDQPLRTDGELLALGFAQDGALWSVEEPGILRKWDLSIPGQVDAHFLDDLATQWAFSPDCSLAASGSDDLTLWDVNRGEMVGSFPSEAWVTAIAFSQDQKFVATGHDDGSICIWDIEEQRLTYPLEAHTRAVSALAFSPDGKVLASSGEEKVIRLWQMSSGDMQDALMCHHDRIPVLLWHPELPRLISAGWDTTARIWDVTTGEPIILLNSHAEQVHQLAITSDGQHLICADSDQDLHLWDLKTFKTLYVWRKQGSEIRSIAVTPDNRRFACGGADRAIRIYDLEQREIQETHPDLLASRASISVSSGNQQLIGLAFGGGINRWEVESQKQLPLPENAGDVRSSALSPDGKVLAVSVEVEEELQKQSIEPTLFLWHAATFAPGQTLRGPRPPITALTFSSDSALLASAGYTSSDVWLWDVARGEPKLLIPNAVEGCSIESLAFHPRESSLLVAGVDWLATSGSDGKLVHWDLVAQKPVQSFDAGSVAVVIHPEGELFASATLGRAIQFWNLKTAELVAELEGHTDQVTCMSFSPDGKWLISGSDDYTLHIWSAHERRLQTTVPVDTQVKAVCFSSDGRYLYTSNANASCYQLRFDQMLGA